ncbi:MAG TPA: HlyD family efflux transporter periplasmic adaptor subunit, partial [Chloroflexota bacterium]
DAAQKGTAAQATAADAAWQAAKAALEADQLQLKHDQVNLDTAHTVDQAAVEQATIDVQTAQDALALAQTNEQKAEMKVQQLSQQPAALTAGQSKQLTPAAAQAAIKQAQHAVDTANLNLQDAQAAADQAGQGASAPASGNGNVQVAPDQSAMDAAQAQLSADQAHLTSLQSGASQSAVDSEQARVNLLHDQAQTAADAAQPVMNLTAPFDGTVTDVGVTPGQTIVAGAASDSNLATVGSSLSGQNSQGVPVAIRMVAAGTTSVVADASESDVAQLSAGQSVDVTFPGLNGPAVTASINQIASTPTTDKNGNVTYPVQIDIPSPPASLKLGMTAQVNLSGADTPTLVAPRAAVQTVSGQSTVTKLDPSGQTQSVQVQVGRSAGGNIQLLGGVQEGDTLLLAPATAPTLPLVAAQQPATTQP